MLTNNTSLIPLCESYVERMAVCHNTDMSTWIASFPSFNDIHSRTFTLTHSALFANKIWRNLPQISIMFLIYFLNVFVILILKIKTTTEHLNNVWNSHWEGSSFFWLAESAEVLASDRLKFYNRILISNTSTTMSIKIKLIVFSLVLHGN